MVEKLRTIDEDLTSEGTETDKRFDLLDESLNE